MVYCGLIALIFILEIAGGVYAYTNRDEVEKKTEKKMREAVIKYGGYFQDGKDGNATVKAVDWFQQKMECCGAKEPIDWINSMWFINHFQNHLQKSNYTVNNPTVKVPDQLLQKPKCGMWRSSQREVLL